MFLADAHPSAVAPAKTRIFATLRRAMIAIQLLLLLLLLVGRAFGAAADAQRAQSGTPSAAPSQWFRSVH